MGQGDSDYEEISILIDGWLWNVADTHEPERKTASPTEEARFSSEERPAPSDPARAAKLQALLRAVSR